MKVTLAKTVSNQHEKGKGGEHMKVKDEVVVVNPFHAHSGRTGTITEIGTDDEGDFIFVTIMDTDGRFGDDYMFEPSDIRVK